MCMALNASKSIYFIPCLFTRVFWHDVPIDTMVVVLCNDVNAAQGLHMQHSCCRMAA